MAIEINGDKSLRRCVYKDLDVNSPEVEKIKVRYGNIEKLVWQKDPLRVYRQQITSIEIEDVEVKSRYYGTYCGEDEYYFTCENNPACIIRTGNISSALMVKISSIKVIGYIDIMLDGYYLYKGKNTTKIVTKDEDEERLFYADLYPGCDYRLSLFQAYSVSVPTVEYSIKVEVTYSDGYVYTFTKTSSITIYMSDTNTSKKYIESVNIPALKN